MASTSLRRALIAVDAAAVALSFGLAWILFDEPFVYDTRVGTGYALLLASPLVWVLAAKTVGLYEPAGKLDVRVAVDDLIGVGSLMTAAAWFVTVSSEVAGKPDPDITQLFTFWLLAIAGITGGRVAARAAIRSSDGDPARRTPRFRWPPPRQVDPRLIAADVAAVVFACAVSWALLHEPRPADSTAWGWVFVAVAVPVWLALAAAAGLYARRNDSPARSLSRDALGTVQLASLEAWAVILLTKPGGEIDPDIPQVFGFWAATILIVVAARALVRGAPLP
jgi:FlaA1/EpsC-like NDP-sugar epimerase